MTTRKRRRAGENAVVARLNEAEFYRLQVQATNAGVDPSGMVTRIIREWLARNPRSLALAYPTCHPCAEGDHAQCWKRDCACQGAHSGTSCPSCKAPEMVRDRGGGPYHPMLYCPFCGHLIMEPCGDGECADCRENVAEYGPWPEAEGTVEPVSPGG